MFWQLRYNKLRVKDQRKKKVTKCCLTMTIPDVTTLGHESVSVINYQFYYKSLPCPSYVKLPYSLQNSWFASCENGLQYWKMSMMWQRQMPESPQILPSFSKWDNLTMFSNEEGKTVLQRAHIYYWGNHQIILDAGIWYQRLNRNLSVGTNIQYLWGYRLF